MLLLGLGNMTRVVTSLDEATAVLDYFNGFHDGFIKKLSIYSHDSFEELHVQSASQRLDLKIIFAHHNYQNGSRPAGQVVTAQFHAVMGLSIVFSGLLYEWSVYELFIGATNRILEDNRSEPCLSAVLLQNRLTDNREWQRHADVTFTFSHAEFDER